MSTGSFFVCVLLAAPGCALAASSGVAPAPVAARPAQCAAFLQQEFTRLRSSSKVNLCESFAGKPLLIVNTASHCGYTPQFGGLEALHRRFSARGLVVIGFPSNDFNQEAASIAETAEVCFVNYGVTFTMLAPSTVTGAKANPVFRELARQTREPEWNFNKYLVTPAGNVVAAWGSDVSPDSREIVSAIEKLL